MVAVALLVPATIFPGQKHKKKSNESLPDGIPVLWRAPSDIAKRDLYWGPGGKAMQPDLRSVALIKKETGGYRPSVWFATPQAASGWRKLARRPKVKRLLRV